MLQNIYSTVYMYVCHSCVTTGNREGSVAPAFVPNRKQTHKEQRRGGRERRDGGGGGGREEGRKRWATGMMMTRRRRRRGGGNYLKFRTLSILWIKSCLTGWHDTSEHTHSYTRVSFGSRKTVWDLSGIALFFLLQIGSWMAICLALHYTKLLSRCCCKHMKTV